MKHEVIINGDLDTWLFSDDLRPCKGIFDEIEVTSPSRCMVCARLMHKKNTSKDCDRRDDDNNDNNSNNNFFNRITSFTYTETAINMGPL